MRSSAGRKVVIGTKDVVVGGISWLRSLFSVTGAMSWISSRTLSSGSSVNLLHCDVGRLTVVVNHAKSGKSLKSESPTRDPEARSNDKAPTSAKSCCASVDPRVSSTWASPGKNNQLQLSIRNLASA